MSITIHHGPPGSFKSFSAVHRFILKELQKGREVWTNVRGCKSLEQIKQLFPELKFPDTAKLVNFRTAEPVQKELYARWFHWVPFGVCIVLDECQSIYPKHRAFNPDKLSDIKPILEYIDFNNVQQTFHGEKRPNTLELAFEMHRHFEWDFIMCTPNISKVHPAIRSCAEFGYRHRSLVGILPWWTRHYLEIQHDPEVTGRSPSTWVGVPKRYNKPEEINPCPTIIIKAPSNPIIIEV
ncbi:MAG: hypothetical protein H7836_17885, partial [Magnetococcus sp. YQC-3]